MDGDSLLQPQDKLFKAGIENPATARSFFEQHLAPEIFHALDWESLNELTPRQEFEGCGVEWLEARFRDLEVEYNAKIKGRQVFIVAAKRRLFDARSPRGTVPRAIREVSRTPVR